MIMSYYNNVISVCKQDSVAISIWKKLFDQSFDQIIWSKVPDINDLFPFLVSPLKAAYEIVSFGICW